MKKYSVYAFRLISLGSFWVEIHVHPLSHVESAANAGAKACPHTWEDASPEVKAGEMELFAWLYTRTKLVQKRLLSNVCLELSVRWLLRAV